MKLRWLFYVQNLDIVFVEMVCAFLFWTVLMLLLNEKAKRIIGAVAAVLSLSAILFMTVFMRSSANSARASFIPFISFVNARSNVEIYRSMLMNVCLFLPLGLSMPFALSGKVRRNVIITIVFALLLSAGVEAIQFVFRSGMCETDDVIMNTLGASTGTLSFLICGGASRLRSKHIHRHRGK